MKLRTLILNVDFIPLSTICWKRAFSLWFVNQEMPGEGLEPIEFYQGRNVRSAGGKDFPIPCVSRVPYYVNRSKRKVPFSRKNVYIRDDLTCQYCGRLFEKDELTLDHVIPRVEWNKKKMKGTPTCWENIVSSCFACNSRKADKSLKDCGLHLINGLPKQPSGGKYVPGIVPWATSLPAEWIPYLKIIYKNYNFGVN